MEQIYKNGTILMVDDDEDDFLLVSEALRESGLPNDVQLVEDGEQMIDYLNRRGKFMSLENSPLPSLILLDLNMPRMDGREALKEIKKTPDFRRIPIVVFTTSAEEEDIASTYELGASSYITKPSTFDGLVEVMKKLGEHWLKVVRLHNRPAENISGQSMLSSKCTY